MEDIYFNGDIVELLNLTKDNIYSMQSSTSDFSDKWRSVLGMRYKTICCFHKEQKFIPREECKYGFGQRYEPQRIDIFLSGFKYGLHYSLMVDSGQIILRERPFKNKVKYLIYKLFKKYYA